MPMQSIRVLGRRIKYSVDELFDHIYVSKVEHNRFVKIYRERPASVIENLMARKYGKRITYRYEDLDTHFTVFAPRMLLANLIAERFLLFYARRILKNITISIVGMGGAGKTTYSIMSSIGALLLLSRVYDEFTGDRIHLLVSSMTFFEPVGMVSTIKRMIEEQKWSPFIIVDDIGSQISKYWIFLGQHFWAYLFSVLDQVKDWCGSLILTAKSLNSIPGRLREISDIVVEAREVTTENGIVADVFEYYRYEDYVSSHSRSSRLKKVMYVDVMPPTTRIPDDLWERMMEIRRATGIRRLGLIEKSIKALPEIEKSRIKKTLERLGLPFESESGSGENVEEDVEGNGDEG